MQKLLPASKSATELRLGQPLSGSHVQRLPRSGWLTWRRMGTAMRVWLGLLFALVLGGAAAHGGYDFVAAPGGHDNGKCTYRRPCSPQGAVKAWYETNLPGVFGAAR